MSASDEEPLSEAATINFLQHVKRLFANIDAREKMTQAERFGEIYQNFVDNQQWFDDLFLDMNFWEYHCFWTTAGNNLPWQATRLNPGSFNG